jgi:replicative DNA helicase
MQEIINLESAIAACVLLAEGSNISQVELDLNDIVYQPAKIVLQAAKELKAIDPVICIAYAKGKNIDIKMSAITDLLQTAATSRNALHYCQELKKLYFAKKSERLKDKYSRLFKQKGADIIELSQLAAYEDHILRLKYLDLDTSKSLVDCCADLISRIDKREENKALVKTGWELLDNLNGGGFLPNELIIIAARPSIGKTAAALQMTSNNDSKGVMFSFEMDNTQIAPRLLASVSKHNTMTAARNPAALSEESRQIFLSAAADLLQKAENLIVYDDHDQTIETVRRRARKEVEKGAKYIIVDYLQLLDDEKEKNRERALAKISRAFKNMGKELQIPIFILAQLNRSCEIEKRPPILSDLRESGAIEQDANTVVFIFDSGQLIANDDGSPSKKKRVFFKQAKGRDTGIGIKQALFNADHQTFYEEPMDYELLSRFGKL